MTPFQTTLVSFTSSITLPSDQRLTIEFVTVWCESREIAVGTTFVALMTRIGETNVNHFFFPRFVLVNDVGLNIYGTTEAVRIYADAGTTVRLDHMDNSHFRYFVTLSGFLSPA